jgi:AcrR family transcriptional regulator
MSSARPTSILSPQALRMPELGIKKAPEQRRSQETYERILRVTATLLADVGVERLSTNLVCQQAGLAPTALYRYFPNKYALLHELGVRLMNAQNVLVAQCLTPQALTDPVEHLQPAMVALFLGTHRITMDTCGGVWIMRALRAVPALQEVRIQSHRTVTNEMHQSLLQLYPEVEPIALRTTVRMSVELVYAMIEMLFDDADLDPEGVAQTTADMVYDMFVRAGVIGPRA